MPVSAPLASSTAWPTTERKPVESRCVEDASFVATIISPTFCAVLNLETLNFGKERLISRNAPAIPLQSGNMPEFVSLSVDVLNRIGYAKSHCRDIASILGISDDVFGGQRWQI